MIFLCIILSITCFVAGFATAMKTQWEKAGMDFKRQNDVIDFVIRMKDQVLTDYPNTRKHLNKLLKQSK